MNLHTNLDLTLYMAKMLTDSESKSQQKRCMAKMLTDGEMKSQQKRCMEKMLTDGELKSQQKCYCGRNAD